LVKAGRLTAYDYDGFWMSMDTFKDRSQLEAIHAAGNAPWEIWNKAYVEPEDSKAASYA
jgi:glucose-1-phosphate cytidylyltransferase